MTNQPDNDQPMDELPLEEMAVMQEPPFDPEDTPATGVYRRVDFEAHKTNPRITSQIKTPRQSSVLNWLFSGAALLVTVAAGVIYLQQNAETPAPTATSVSQAVIELTAAPATDVTSPTVSPTQVMAAGDTNVPLDVVAESLTVNGDTAPPPDRLYRRQTAYTIAPARSRSEVSQYTIQPGDTLDKIAERFGITTDTLSWANSDQYVNRLLPGDTLTILPENGVLHKTVQGDTIQSIATKYKVSPFTIIDSEYNKLQNARPETLLPPSLTVVVPGGTGTSKPRYWDPGTLFRPKSGTAAGMTGGSGASSNADGEVSFGGGPGSCGYQPNAGGGGLRVPLGGSYTVIRGFYPGHTGIDLASPTGTTVFAAANGTVIFAGWSNWGYGNSIVLAHGNILTLYGHLSRVNVSCGQAVNAGQPIGAVGSTGNSSGPHLHFEIRPGGEPVNPVGYLSF
jgi:murein DD-endopeptidase MepM/ murein hydrolase activator NlpD